MDATRWAVRLSVLLAVGLLAGLTINAMLHAGDAAVVPLLTKEGQPVPVPTESGYTLALWNDRAVVVFVAPAARLAGVEALRGEGEATPSVPLPGDPGLRMFAFYATPPRHCAIVLHEDLDASKDIPDYDGDGAPDGRGIDPCHHAQFDIYHRAEPIPGTPARSRLPVLDVFVRDGHLYATGFDAKVPPPG